MNYKIRSQDGNFIVPSSQPDIPSALYALLNYALEFPRFPFFDQFSKIAYLSHG